MLVMQDTIQDGNQEMINVLSNHNYGGCCDVLPVNQQMKYQSNWVNMVAY